MIRTLRRIGFAALALSAPVTLFAHGFAVGDLVIGHPWAAPPPPGAPSVAGYLSVTNDGDREDRLVGASAAFAEAVELHESRIENDVVSMRELMDGVVIPAGEKLVFAPSGKHLMFVSPEPLLEGEVRAVTLRFERAGEVEVRFSIEQPADGVAGTDAGAGAGAGGTEGMDHSKH